MMLLKQSEGTAARRRVLIYLLDDTDGKTAETGVTVAAGDIKISKNGAAEANHAGTWTEIAGGLYYYEFTAGELDTLGFVTFRIVQTGVRTFVTAAQVVPFDPYDAVRLGLTAVPNTTAGASGGLPTIDANLRVAALVGAYASGQTPADHVLATPAQKLATDAAGRAAADVERWKAGTPNDLITGRVDANAQVVGDKTGYGLADGAITAAKIADGALTAAKAAAGFFDAVWSVSTRTLTGLGTALVQEIWDRATSALVTAGSIGKLLVDNVNATISSRSSHSAADVWAVGSRTLTSFGTLVADIWGHSTRTLTAFSTALAVSIWDVLETAIATASSIGLKVKTNLDAAVSTRAPEAGGNVAAIKAKTDVLPADPAAQAKLDVLHDTRLTAARAANLDNLNATVGSRAAPGDAMTLTGGERAAVADAVADETLPELPQAQPPAVPSFRQAIMLGYMALRNRLTTTSTEMAVRNDAGTVIAKAALSDDGTTHTRDKLATGP